LIAKRVEFLTGYQNAAYAQTYQAYVQKVRAVDESVGGKKLALTEAVARYLFKLMAYKDEYEVARLHTDAGFHAKINAMFEGDFKLNYHLAPPGMAKKNAKGELQKKQFGPAMLTGFKLLARLKGLRGTALDPFGYTQERREERALITEYRALLEELLGVLGRTDADQTLYPQALELARIPEQIRGFGHVKARNLLAVRQSWATQLDQFRHPQALQKTA
jgi:indolepyruvate ferredoxin oxidoreductase